MKLRNKQTGEIATLTLSSNGEELLLMKNNEMVTRNVKLSDLKGWQDYEEPKEKEYWFIDAFGNIVQNKLTKHRSDAYTDMTDLYETQKQIGNYFETKEEAEKAVEKLKAITRLKSCGFKFNGWRTANLGADKYYFVITAESDGAGKDDLDLLFGGEE